MKINNFSEKKIGKNKSEKKNENVDNEIEISEEKDKMNISFLNEFEANNNSYWNSNINNNNKIFNFDNSNILDNITITRSKTIKCCDKMKFNFFNSQSESITSQIFHNSINQFSRMNSISSINSSVTNISNAYEFKKVSTFKEKPKLSSLPLMHMNSLKNKNSIMGLR